MLTKFQTIVDRQFPFLRNARLYLAISGGKDSMTLSSLLLESGIKHMLLHCNFQLRGKESERDEQFLRDYAVKNHLEIHVKNFDTSQIAEAEKMTIQECARKLRYEWFRTFLEQDENAYLLTAHHLDDSIETFFINLFRGTGYRGLSGIPVNAHQIIRPLSDFTAEEIYRYMDANHIEYRSDSTNAKKDYLRNKVRHELIPVLADLEPHFQGKMSAVFEELSAVKAYLDTEAENFRNAHQHLENKVYKYDLDVVKKCQSFLREQVFRPFGIHRKNADEFSKFLHAETGAQFKTSAFQFLIDREELIITENVETASSVFIEINHLENKLDLDQINLRIERKKEVELIRDNPRIQQLDFAKVQFPVIIRTWQQGDKMKPLGMDGHKLISDILIDKKINRYDKSHQLVMVDAQGTIISLLRLAVSEDCKVAPHTKTILEINTIQ